MSSTAFYGGYQHAPRQVAITEFRRENIRSQNGYTRQLQVTCGIKSRIILPTIPLIFAERDAMRIAYSVDGQPFAIYDDSSGQPIWAVDSSTSLGGVKVINPVSHGAVEGSMGTTFLDCNITLQADYLTPLGDGQYLTFQESLSFSGRGGPLFVRRLPLNGLPFKQKVTEKSWFTMTQSGSLTTNVPRPSPMQPMFPALFDGTEDDANVEFFSPITMKSQPVEWGVRWSYRYSSPVDMLPSANLNVF